MTVSPLKIMGGKSASAERIVAAFPNPSTYDYYIEPCGGAAHVMLRKPLCHHKEIYNDLDDLLVNFWMQLQAHPVQLREMVCALPYSRKMYYDFYHSLYGTKDTLPDTTLSDIDKAVRWFYSLRGNMTGYMRQSTPGWTTLHQDALKSVTNLFESVQRRFDRVAIDNRDAIETVKRYARQKWRILFYVDTPYMGTEHYYSASRHGFDHAGMAQTLNSLLSETPRIQIAFSCYPHPLIDEWYPVEKWRRITWQQHKPSNVSENSTELDIATELLLCNYDEPVASLWDEASA